MSDNAMLFQPPMVRALWEGRKTQTRRPLYTLRKGDSRAQMRAVHDTRYLPPALSLSDSIDHYYDLRHILSAGDRIWVKENWRADVAYDKIKPSDLNKQAALWFQAYGDRPFVGDGVAGKLRPSIFLPRWASRMTLIVTETRIERLQDISHDDAIAEGIERAELTVDGETGIWYRGHKYAGWRHADWKHGAECYRDLWDHINGDGAWKENPWVVAYTFDVIRLNIDAEAGALTARKGDDTCVTITSQA